MKQTHTHTHTHRHTFYLHTGPDPYTYFCDSDDHKCKGGMKIKEGEECKWCESGYLSGQIESSLQCEEGLVCAPSVEDDDKCLCQKTRTTPDNLRYCYDDDDCGYDANCECNDIIGKRVCVPVPSSSKKLQSLYFKFEEDENIDTAAELYEYLVDNYLYIDAEYRCQRYLKEYSAASAVKASALATIALALLALF